MNNVFSFIEKLLHCIKEILLSILPPKAISKSMKVNLRLRAVVLFGTFAVVLLISGYYLYPVLMSLGFFLVCLYVLFFFCHHIFNRGWLRNLLFMIIFCAGVYSYIKLSEACSQTAVVSSEKQVKTASENNQQIFYQKLFPSAYYSHIVTGAFFPSRGTYEIDSDGTIYIENKPKIALPYKVLLFYLIFHASVYIFVGYFIMSLWGYRTINRMRFWLLKDCEKSIFWCIIPEPKMMQLAKDIKNKANEISIPVFSVEATAIDEDDAKNLFQEMNYQYFCLKLRNPDQIHNQCLRAVKHFFLSENADWNIKMAEALLSKRQNIKNTAKIYIRINSDIRNVYYTRWAEKYSSNTVEIIFIDECALIVDKFIQKHHLLTSGITVNKDASINKTEGFNFLLLGFGGLGQEVLKHLICDSRFIDSDGKLVKFHANIVDQDAKKLSLFREQFKALCNHRELNVQLDFHRRYVGGGGFYTFLEDNLLKPEQKYDRIIIALGNPELNIETVAQIENIIRKNLNLAQGCPSEELKSWKRKIFLVSPEVRGSLVDNDNNIFTLIGADNEIFTWADIVNEEMFERAKLVNFRYSIDHSIEEEKKRIAAMRKWLPQKLVKIGNEKEFRNKVENEWRKANFYSRRSSYAAALGLENIRLLLNDRSAEDMLEQLGKIEHYRWWAFMLGEGYVTWQNPEQRLGSLEKANQTSKFLRHATMVEWEKLPDMDEIFRSLTKFSLEEEIENLLISKLTLTMRMNMEKITPSSNALPAEGIITITVSGGEETDLNVLFEKVEQLSQIEGAIIGIEKNDQGKAGMLYLKKEEEILLQQRIDDISERDFAVFSAKECSAENKLAVAGYKTKDDIIKVSSIKPENITSRIQSGKKKKRILERLVHFEGVFQCKTSLEKQGKTFQEKDYELIKGLSDFFEGEQIG